MPIPPTGNGTQYILSVIFVINDVSSNMFVVKFPRLSNMLCDFLMGCNF